jgi:hypothetical protein
MPTDTLSGALARVRGALARGTDLPLSDGQLLARFAADRDGEAFAALVRRHGPMVFGVCRRVTGDFHQAEDATQAVFLVLARRAADISQPDRIGPWLYGVACRTARAAGQSGAGGGPAAGPAGAGAGRPVGKLSRPTAIPCPPPHRTGQDREAAPRIPRTGARKFRPGGPFRRD